MVLLGRLRDAHLRPEWRIDRRREGRRGACRGTVPLTPLANAIAYVENPGAAIERERHGPLPLVRPPQVSASPATGRWSGLERLHGVLSRGAASDIAA